MSRAAHGLAAFVAAGAIGGVVPGVAASRTWTIQSVPAPAGVASSQLNAVSCPSAANCMAVGTWEASSSQAPGYTDQPFAELWDGSSWTLVNMPAPAGADNIAMTGISCTAATACTAIGYSFVQSTQTCLGTGDCSTTPAGYTSFAERWDGGAWTVQTVPNPSSQTRLLGISCTSASSCTAVGRYDGQYTTTLAERWDGNGWSMLGSSPPIDGWFASVSCPADNACFAAGDNAGHPLAEKWNGGVWAPQVTPDPNPASTSGGTPDFTGVWCASATVCTAVGDSYTLSPGGYFAGSAFAEELANGSVWSAQAIGNPPGTSATQLASVSCRNGSQCTAVGASFTAPSNGEHTVAARWNGASWTTEQPPDPAVTVGSRLQSVACVTATACIAVGDSGSGPNGTAQPLVEQSS